MRFGVVGTSLAAVVILLGIVTSLDPPYFFMIIGSIASLILSIIGLVKDKKKGYAATGTALSVFALAFTLFLSYLSVI